MKLSVFRFSSLRLCVRTSDFVCPTGSTFCFLLSLAEYCDADNWGTRLLELIDRGFAPGATVAD
jgi:hypothetical protein